MAKNVKTAKRPQPQQQTGDSRTKTILWAIGGVIGFGLIVLLAFSIAGEGEVDPAVAFGDPVVEGDPLPFLADPQAGDPALGIVAPTVAGADWEGNTYSIEPDGRPKIIMFLAHWCPHCQAEVPLVQQWLDSGGLPDTVDMYSFTVLNDHLRPEWPPQEWLENEGWSVPVIMDDEHNSLVQAFGMRGTPFYVVLDGQNRNLGRFAGQVGIHGLETMVQMAQLSLEG